MAIASILEPIAGWFTPTVLFCVANLIVATIFFTNSNNKNPNHHANGPSKSINRLSSFLDRARSFDLRSNTTAADSHHQYPTQSTTAVYGSSSRLAQSIHFTSTPPELSLSTADEFPPSEPEPEQQQVSQPGVVVSSLFERVKSVKFSSDYNDSDNDNDNENNQISDSPGRLARAPSFLDRVRSFKIASPFKSEPESNSNRNQDHHATRSKSEKKKPTTKQLPEMKKSRSEMRLTPDDDENEEDDVDSRRPATARLTERRSEFDDEVDAKADDFITRFKKQLKLQRLESLVRYNEMLNRGN